MRHRSIEKEEKFLFVFVPLGTNLIFFFFEVALNSGEKIKRKRKKKPISKNRADIYLFSRPLCLFLDPFTDGIIGKRN